MKLNCDTLGYCVSFSVPAIPGPIRCVRVRLFIVCYVSARLLVLCVFIERSLFLGFSYTVYYKSCDKLNRMRSRLDGYHSDTQLTQFMLKDRFASRARHEDALLATITESKRHIDSSGSSSGIRSIKCINLYTISLVYFKLKYSVCVFVWNVCGCDYHLYKSTSHKCVCAQAIAHSHRYRPINSTIHECWRLSEGFRDTQKQTQTQIHGHKCVCMCTVVCMCEWRLCVHNAKDYLWPSITSREPNMVTRKTPRILSLFLFHTLLNHCARAPSQRHTDEMYVCIFLRGHRVAARYSSIWYEPMLQNITHVCTYFIQPIHIASAGHIYIYKTISFNITTNSN